MTRIKAENRIGQKFGRLVVKLIARREGVKSRAVALCQCECGKQKEVRVDALISGKTLSCGCLNSENITGQVFGALYVVKKLKNKNKNNQHLYDCICGCGEHSIVLATSLLTGNTTTCGCRMTSAGFKHGVAGSPFYKRYQSMVARCYNKGHHNYKNYGGRGVFVCDKWKNDIGAYVKWCLDNGLHKNKKLQVDRIDNDGPYDPSNCRLVTSAENLKNRRVH